MKLTTASFRFEGGYRVVFHGSEVSIYDEDDQLIGSHANRWTSRGKPDGGVMGRAFKPRVTDAQESLRMALASQKQRGLKVVGK